MKYFVIFLVLIGFMISIDTAFAAHISEHPNRGGVIHADPTNYKVEEKSPLFQYKIGISYEEIHCNDTLVKIQKYDGSPACVMEQTKQKLIERGWTKQSLPPCTSDRSACFNQESNLCDPSGWECGDNEEVFSETISLQEPKKYSIAFPYIWNDFLHKQGIKFEPKEQSYINTDEGWYSGLNRVCSPIVTSDGTELFISSTFIHEPFEIRGTFIDKTKPNDCHKIWKTETILPEPDKNLKQWLENYHKNQSETIGFDSEYAKAKEIYLEVRSVRNLPFIGLTTDVNDKDTILLGINSDKMTEEKDKEYYTELVDDLFKDVKADIKINFKHVEGIEFDE